MTEILLVAVILLFLANVYQATRPLKVVEREVVVEKRPERKRPEELGPVDLDRELRRIVRKVELRGGLASNIRMLYLFAGMRRIGVWEDQPSGRFGFQFSDVLDRWSLVDEAAQWEQLMISQHMIPFPPLSPTTIALQNGHEEKAQ
ncbi:hypothetical protein Rctr85_053 [Virus Rctr85]|nr:hypothetical protein Rctr85_053 [Virus Rctr85]